MHTAGQRELNGLVLYVQLMGSWIACDQKWQHILKNRRVGVYTVLDGQTVREFLKFHVTISVLDIL